MKHNNIINEDSDPDDIDLIHHSPYNSPCQMPNHIKFREGFFGVLSLNAQSIQAKFSNYLSIHSINAFTKYIDFPVICIQETWLNDNSRLPLVSLNGYQTFHSNASSSTHGGFITYVDEKYDVSVIKKIEMSTTWNGLFLKLKHEEMQNEVIIGNLYKPPRNSNNIANIRAIIEEIEPILQDLNSHDSEVFICGDFNTNILKMNDEKHFADFLDTMLAYSFYPQITFPTRLNNTSGTNLIDNIYYKLSSRLNKTMSGMITDPMSDHFPYFMCMNITETKKTIKTLGW